MSHSRPGPGWPIMGPRPRPWGPMPRPIMAGYIMPRGPGMPPGKYMGAPGGNMPGMGPGPFWRCMTTR
jgi:hypothetical protein